MPLAQSKVTAQGQISIPAEVRRKLGIGPGALLEWDEEDGLIVVRKAGLHSSEDVHRALFGTKRPRRRSPEKIKEGIRRRMKSRHARS